MDIFPEDHHLDVKMIGVGDVVAPGAPTDIRNTGIDPIVLSGLALKLAYSVQQFTTDWMIDQMRLPQSMVMDILDALRTDKLVEVLGEAGSLTYSYKISSLGRERAARLLEISGYVGPAPVSVDAYTDIINWETENFVAIKPDRVEAALNKLVLRDEARDVVGLALTSGRSLLVHGPPGNGKTSIGRLLHNALKGTIWIPYAIAVDNSIIRLYDPQVHKIVPHEFTHEESQQIDQRWICIERPFIVVGGELTLDALDLGFDPSHRYYEAPLHLKANGGTFLLDDFGRQRVEPDRLLNRWIIPLEHQVDYLTLNSGQKVQVPLRQMLVISTGLDPDAVVDPAFLRRIGYRLYQGSPTEEAYGQILKNYAAQFETVASSSLIQHLLDRYRAENRSLRGSEPGELIDRARDICRYQGRTFELSTEIMDLAWKGYFGDQDQAH